MSEGQSHGLLWLAICLGLACFSSEVKAQVGCAAPDKVIFNNNRNDVPVIIVSIKRPVGNSNFRVKKGLPVTESITTHGGVCFNFWPDGEPEPYPPQGKYAWVPGGDCVWLAFPMAVKWCNQQGDIIP